MMTGKIRKFNLDFLSFFIFLSALLSSYYFNLISIIFIYLFSIIASNISTKIGLKIAKRYKIFQKIREEGPSSHILKADTPTMGGVFFIPIFLFIILLSDINIFPLKIILLITILSFFLIGLSDDLLSIKYNRNLGLNATQKLLLQTLISVFFIVAISNIGLLENNITIFKNTSFNIERLIFPISLLTIIGLSNAVNLTDGLDGLASGCSAIVFCGLGTEILLHNNPDQIVFSLLCYSMSGLCLGFLNFNKYPAKVFMGDSGSLCIGATLGVICILTNSFFTTFILSGIFIVETLSVIAQVIYFKFTKYIYIKGRRLLLMSPLHHHYELKGYKEETIVEISWKINIVLVILSIVLKISFL